MSPRVSVDWNGGEPHVVVAFTVNDATGQQTIRYRLDYNEACDLATDMTRAIGEIDDSDSWEEAGATE